MTRKSRLWIGSIALLIATIFLYGIYGLCFFLIVNSNSQTSGMDGAATLAHYATDAFFKGPIIVCLLAGVVLGILALSVKDSS